MQGRGGRVWQVAGVKLFLDGTIDGGTAWLDEPDSLGESTRSIWGDPGRYSRAVHALAAAGVPTATHAIGDAAVRHALDTLAAAPAPTGARHRIEHLETAGDADLARFAAAAVVASMQPTHATEYTSADGSDNWSRRLGPERAALGWRCADLLAAGATLVLGSDWPVAPFDPRGILAAAQTRRSARRPDLPPVGAAQAITASQAVDAMTRAPAVAAGDLQAGRVAVGHRADLDRAGRRPPRRGRRRTALGARRRDGDGRGVVRYRREE